MLCEYGNCHEDEKLPITVTIRQKFGGGERKRFCTEYHAALWLLRWAKTSEQNLDRRAAAGLMLDTAHKE